MQQLILAESAEERDQCVAKLLPFQREDIKEILRVMDGLPVTVRLLDPPIHEFLPSEDELIDEIEHLRELKQTVQLMADLPDTLKLLDPELHTKYSANLESITLGLEELKHKHLEEELIMAKETMRQKLRALSETNPMLGHRGVRLALPIPKFMPCRFKRSWKRLRSASKRDRNSTRLLGE